MRVGEDHRSDNTLLQEYRHGDVQAFTCLVRRYQSTLFSFIKRMVGEHGAAEDLFQETFIRVLHHADSYRDEGKFQAWLFGIARNLCIDHARRKSLQPVLSGGDEGSCEAFTHHRCNGDALPDMLLESKEREAILTEAVNGLPLSQRDVFLLRRHGGLSFQEIAVSLNRPLGTVLGQMRSALFSIRRYVESRYEYEPHDR